MSSAWIRYRQKMEAIRIHKTDILNYFFFRLNAETILIYGVKQSRSRISSISSSDESIEDSERPAKRMILVCMPHDFAMKKNTRHMLEIMGDKIHRSQCRMSKCNALTTVRCSSAKYFCVSMAQETVSIDSMQHREFIHFDIFV
ncbi:uncharacterized protein NPIL_33851 [Nephila pilipes]|uniref:Uncharacterized protein n=1 Tax=Nephila pilipes TaxID=299642 RepID=A0A8X6QQF3_NEPPI|nr:uncharacterized protein NPIL_33851 [Nephila pilipes]